MSEEQDLKMCTALKFKNFLVASEASEENIFVEAVQAFESSIISQSLTGVGSTNKNSHGVFYMFDDGSVAGIFPTDLVLADPDMVLKGYVQQALIVHEKQAGVQKVKHDG